MTYILTLLLSWCMVGGNHIELAKKWSVLDSKDFETLNQLIENQDQQPLLNVQEFLLEWKKQKPHYFSNYVLGYRSRSLQQSSFQYPRAILFNDNSDLVLTFNGHPEHKGYQNLEVMRFNHDEKSFEFYEIDFIYKQARISEKNPRKCMQCHQSSVRKNKDPRPNWEPYNTWLGFYGSIDDSTDLFFSGMLRDKILNLQDDKVAIEDIKQESDQYYEFQSTQMVSDPRYSLLDDISGTRYSTEKTINGILTDRLASLNFQRVARLIRTQNPEHYQRVKWILWGQVHCGNKLFLPTGSVDWLYSQIRSHDFERLEIAEKKRQETQMFGRYYEKVINNRTVVLKAPPPKYRSIRRPSHTIDILFEAFGESTQDWSMDFKTDGAQFATFERFGVPSDTALFWNMAMTRELAKDPDFKGANCEQAELESQKVFPSLKSLKEQQKIYSILYSQKYTPKPLIQSCTGCHVYESYAFPYIPFDNKDKLKVALTKPGYKRGLLIDEIKFRLGSHATKEEQMPKSFVPTPKQRTEMLEYLNQLLNQE